MRRIIGGLLGILGVFLVVAWLRYRIPMNKSVVIEREVIFKVIDLGFDDFFRCQFESLFFHRRLCVVDANGNQQAFFVREKDFAKCWKNSPFKLKELNKTLVVNLQIRPLYFGGYGIAKVKHIEMIAKSPIIRK